MSESDCTLFKNSVEFQALDQINTLPDSVRGLYVLFNKGDKKPGKNENYLNVVYIGLSGVGKTKGIKSRLLSHRTDKIGRWTHFSAYEVWDNVTSRQISELEGLFRHIFRNDALANQLAVQKAHKPLLAIRRTSAKFFSSSSSSAVATKTKFKHKST